MEFHMTIDFPDDLTKRGIHWDEKTIRRLIATLPERGIRTIHWIDYPMDPGIWGKGTWYDDHDGRASRLLAEIPSLLKVVCDEAHRQGMECYAVLKPDDFALCSKSSNYPVGEEPDPAIGPPRIGGSSGWCMSWLRDHPETRLTLHPSLQTRGVRGSAIRRIRLWHENADIPDIEPLRLWVSDNNGKYRQYEGKMQVRATREMRRTPRYAPAPSCEFEEERECGLVEISELDILEDFIVLEFLGKRELWNTLFALMEVEDEDGVSIPYTYGFDRIQGPYELYDWRDHGLAFDYHGVLAQAEGQTSAHYSRLRNRVCLAGLEHFGFARGRNTYLDGPLEFAYPEVRQWLLGLIASQLDAGVDGVDLRLGSHSSSFDFENYGFSPPVIDEYRRRYGVDMTSEAFDRASFRRLRGEYFGEFMRAASELVHSRGKSFLFHASTGIDHGADEICYSDMAFDWRTWVEGGWIDAITEKQGEFDSDFSLGLRDLRVPVILNRKPNGGAKHTEANWLDILDRARVNDYEKFNIYELNTFYDADERGEFRFRFPDFWKRVADLAS